ncbi:MAG: arsenosugar biosynthesis radical SAM protein ArsS [Gammaproteobacteria bacterium]|nr:arsenosugar biosynthesis radical SAM protein ArsS [Gammaproteobacteria bacterium]
MLDTWPLLKETNFPNLKRAQLDTLQVNLGYLCNQQCLHCHVDAGPRRTEIMELSTIQTILDVLKKGEVNTLDLTGGAPEMNPHFKYLVSEARKLNVKIIDRCNLTVLSEPGHEDLAQFLADYEVEIVASLPCYLEENVDGQRGKGVYQKSIDGLQKLNALGYGYNDKSLQLNLVYNPTGAFLPPSQESLEVDYKKFLKEQFDIVFNHIFTITNMPIARFGSTLVSKGEFSDYMTLLKDSFSAENVKSLMCRSQVSVDWQGYLYDCDFNQMLKLNTLNEAKQPVLLSDLLGESIQNVPIIVADHCYGCTAGQGSSCGGAFEQT